MRNDRVLPTLRVGAALVAVVVLTGCAVGNSKDEGGSPRRDLAARPSSIAPVPTDTIAPSASGSAGPAASGGAKSPGASAGSSGGPGDSTGPSGGASNAPPPPPFHSVASVSDRSGDAGATTPGYGDIVSVTIEDNGPSARLTISMRSNIPATLPANETMGVGVDLYRSPGEIESDYQVFADGEPSGWYAYFTGPKGQVKFPGTFGLGGNRMVFTIPWSAFGSPSSGYFSGFADWTRAMTPANLSGEDHAPDLAVAPYQR